ncbi:MAG: SBBP repeat-containing protein [Candidatus Cloacimonadales bacterium]|nr:SBBP repeat-containing protein [Candidatus Cloacimonadales bacterium]
MKKTIMNLVLMLIAVCAFAQAPEWQWAIKAGSIGSDCGFGITIDDNGNSYVTGWFEETATFGSYSLTSSGECDIFAAKMDATGNWLWAAQAGGTGWDEGYGITIDDNGNSYVTGTFGETATFDSYSLTSGGEEDVFVAKMDATGNWLWATKAGGSSYDYSWGIAIDDNGNSYVTGYFAGTATFGFYTLTSSGNEDIFVAKMDANGNWQWATRACGTGEDRGYAITADDTGNSYVTGNFEDTATFGSYSLTSSGDLDIFVAKMDATGNWLWATRAGGSDYAVGEAITIDNTGNSYVTGCFEGTATFGSYSLTSSGEVNIFVAKMDADGNWQWATRAGGSTIDVGEAITIDNNGNSYVTGRFYGTATFGSYSLTGSGEGDIFVAKLGNETSVENEFIPTKMELSNYPNPFNPETTISFSIQQNSKIELEIFNVKGQLVKSLINGQQNAGDHSVIWNGKDDNGNNVCSGIYLYKLQVNNKSVAIRKCLLLK